jgi:hypothetical protein
MVPTAEQRRTRFPNYKQTAISNLRGENGNHFGLQLAKKTVPKHILFT